MVKGEEGKELLLETKRVIAKVRRSK